MRYFLDENEVTIEELEEKRKICKNEIDLWNYEKIVITLDYAEKDILYFSTEKLYIPEEIEELFKV